MSEPTRPPTSFIPAQPAVLVIGERRLPIDEWPLARSVEERRSVEVGWPADSVLAIEPTKRAGGGILLRLILAFLAGAVPAAIALAFEVPAWLAITVGLAIALLFFAGLSFELSRLRRVQFDRQAGQLLIQHRRGLRRAFRADHAYPLRSILAVQLLYSGRHSVTEPQGAGEQQTMSHREYCGYELNLVLEDPHVPRVNLFSLADWEWVRRTGQAIGEFLGVPVIDKLHHGG
jgi:hypothetical protein